MRWNYFILLFILLVSCGKSFVITEPSQGLPPEIISSLDSISYNNSHFNEDYPTLNGTSSNTIDVTLTQDTFAHTGTLVANIDYQLSGTPLPSGVTLLVSVQNSRQATINLIGAPASHNLSDSLQNIEFSFLSTAFTSGHIPTDGSESLIFGINYLDNYHLSSSGVDFDEDFDPFTANSPILTTQTLTLSGGTFGKTSLVLNTDYTLSQTLPAGLTLNIQVDTPTQLTLRIIGTPTAISTESHDSVLGIELIFLNAAFTSHIAPIDGSATYTFNINFADMPNFIFQGGTSKGGLGGIAGINNLCRIALGTMGLPSQYSHAIGLISVDVNNQMKDIPNHYSYFSTSRPLYMNTGEFVSNSWTDFLNGSVSNIITSRSNLWWSGSKPDGSIDALTWTCNAWTTSVGSPVGPFGQLGNSSQIKSTSGTNVAGCGQIYPFLCIAY
ncbi:MAG: hypothetical protein KBD63_02045 [Bacteriovoracaceae bacterium]|nr:hypothetical protein [Bacteriovoracaceae bacterium]